MPQDLVRYLLSHERVDVALGLAREPIGEVEGGVFGRERGHGAGLDERERVAGRVVSRRLRGAVERVGDLDGARLPGRWIVREVRRCGRDERAPGAEDHEEEERE